MIVSLVIALSAVNGARHLPGQYEMSERSAEANGWLPTLNLGGALSGSKYKCSEKQDKCYCDVILPKWESCANNAKFPPNSKGNCVFRSAKSDDETCSTLSPFENHEDAVSVQPGLGNIRYEDGSDFGCDLKDDLCDCFIQKNREWTPLADGGIHGVQNETGIADRGSYTKARHMYYCRLEYNIEGGRVLPPKPDLPPVTSGLPSAQITIGSEGANTWVEGKRFSCFLKDYYLCDCQATFPNQDPKFCRNNLMYEAIFPGGRCHIAYDEEECYVVEKPVTTTTVAITTLPPIGTVTQVA